MNTLRNTIAASLLVASLGMAAAAWAQDDTGSMGQEKAGTMKEGRMGMHHMMGQHSMPGTVTSVDKKTGMVDVSAEGMTLRVHFPPSAVAELKSGDRITLHLGFSKAE